MKKNDKQYYEISEESPHILPNLKATYTSFKNCKLPKPQSFFFIDFTEQCQLRMLKKRKEKADSTRALEMQTFGRNVILNIEDSSPSQLRLVRYQQQLNKIKMNKRRIYDKIKDRFAENKKKIRSKSYVTIKQEFIDLVTNPIPPQLNPEAPVKSEKEKVIIPRIDEKYTQLKQSALKRIGIFRLGYQY